MTDVDKLIQIDLIAFREQALAVLQQRNPQLMAIAAAVLSDRKNRLGLEITADGRSIGQYTLYLDGVKLTHAEKDKLDPQIQDTPLGTIRLYASIELAALQRLLADQRLIADPLAGIGGYLPEVTLRFLP